MRIRLRFARHLAPVLIFSLNSFALEIGDEWQEPPAELGRPLGRIVTGDKTLYRWPDLEVTVAAGRVTQIRRLDAASVAAESEQRGKQNATERARLLAERKERARKDAEQLARDQAAAEEAGRQAEAKRRRAEQVLAAEEAARAAALRAEEAKAGREKRERMANADKERAETARHLKELAREESEARAKREAEVAASAASAAKATMERQAAASAAESSSSGFALVKSPTDPVARLTREIEIFEQDLRRAELGTEPRDRAEAARLRLLLRDKRAQLDAARAKR